MSLKNPESPVPRVPGPPALHGFTLVELLVVITIIGILIALLLPAVQAAREAARQMQCSNHLKQIALACMGHEEQQGYFPSSGWGYLWTGDPDRGFGPQQTGGWIFNILPFLEQESVYNLPADGSPNTLTDQQMKGAALLHETPLEIMNCPTRRKSLVYPNPILERYRPYNCNHPLGHAYTDYAANSGDAEVSSYPWGPSTLAQGDNPNFNWNVSSCQVEYSTGVSFVRSQVTIADISDGTSLTYLVGEKYLAPDHYEDGATGGDNSAMYVGQDVDTNRWTDPEKPAHLYRIPRRFLLLDFR